MATAIVGILVLVALFFALKGVVKHWRGESSCCGGGDVKVPKKKLTGTIVETKIVDIEGMTCGHCEMSVQEEISEIAGVTAVNADHKTGQVAVEGAGFTDEQVSAAVAEAGYKVV